MLDKNSDTANLIDAGRKALSQWSEGFYGESATIGVIMACIERGETSQEGIVSTVRKVLPRLVREIVDVMRKYSGEDPSEALWNRHPETGYRLL